MAKCDEDAKEFFRDMKEWKRYIQKWNDTLKDGKDLDEGNKKPQDEQDATGNDIDEEDGISVNSSSSESVEDPKRVAAREILVNLISSNNYGRPESNSIED